MDKYILGISAFYHDSAACIIKNNTIIAAAQEERFSRKKHDPRFPYNAINYCLEEAFIEPEEIDLVCFYDNPLLTWDRIIKNSVMMGEESLEIFNGALPSVLGIKVWVEDHVRKAIGTVGKVGKIMFAGHHASHAASAFYPSPYTDAAILTLDGVGEWSTTTIGHGMNKDLKILKEINYPHSLGLLYSAFTYYCGFKVNSGEYKLMGLAPYGKPKYVDLILGNLIDLKEDGSYRLDTTYFGYLSSMVTTNDKFHQLMGGAPREPESRISQREMNLAASIQKVIEIAVIRLGKTAKALTGSDNLVMAGGVALNCVANGKLQKEKIFKNIWIQPAAGDAGGALGAALIAAHMHYDIERNNSINNAQDSQQGSLLGPSFSANEIEAYLERNNYVYQKITNQDKKFRLLASYLEKGRVIGFFSGRMEFGPRALGSRSIIGDARNAEMQSKMNLKIKYRESFRPFAPSVLAEDCQNYFDFDEESPYMLMVAPVKEERRNYSNSADDDEDMIQIINRKRSDIPAVTHVDYSARIQTVSPTSNAPYYKLISAFKELTNYGVIVNTSFNVRGEPIVCTPQDAYTCLMRTEMDVLALDDFILLKEEQPKFIDKVNWQETYELD